MKLSIENFNNIKIINEVGFTIIYLFEEKSTQKEYVAIILLSYDENEENQMLHEIYDRKHPTIIKVLGRSYENFKGSETEIIFMDYAQNFSFFDLLKSIQYQIIDNTTRQIILVGAA